MLSYLGETKGMGQECGREKVRYKEVYKRHRDKFSKGLFHDIFPAIQASDPKI
jgi:hypothetical protein